MTAYMSPVCRHCGQALGEQSVLRIDVTLHKFVPESIAAPLPATPVATLHLHAACGAAMMLAALTGTGGR